MGQIIAANIILAVLAPKPTGHEASKNEAIAEKRKIESHRELLDKTDLAGLGEWSEDEQKEAWELITEYSGIFALSIMDLGKTSLVKHSIRLTDNTPLKVALLPHSTQYVWGSSGASERDAGDRCRMAIS